MVFILIYYKGDHFYLKGVVNMQVNELKQIKKDLAYLINKKEGNHSLAVKIYCDEIDEFNVEIEYSLDGEYQKHFFTDEYESENEATVRAKLVLKTVKKWFNIEVDNKIEIYSC